METEKTEKCLEFINNNNTFHENNTANVKNIFLVLYNDYLTHTSIKCNIATSSIQKMIFRFQNIQISSLQCVVHEMNHMKSCDAHDVKRITVNTIYYCCEIFKLMVQTSQLWQLINWSEEFEIFWEKFICSRIHKLIRLAYSNICNTSNVSNFFLGLFIF